MSSPAVGRHARTLPHRPALDGLRGVAVLAVLGHHVAFPVLPGGWFGVDIFFVLSGFLITSLLLGEHEVWGRLSLPRFWAARARRLLPALVLMLGAVLVVASRLSLPARRGAIAGDALATLGYVANWRFLVGDESYFGTILAPSPLRHTWSLGVEEQFYLLFPLLLGVLLAAGLRRIGLAVALAVPALASAALMAHLHRPGLDASRVYYGTDTRVFELLIGAVFAVLLGRAWRSRPDAAAPASAADEAAPATGPVVLASRLDRLARGFALPGLLVLAALTWGASFVQDVLFEGGLLISCVVVALVVVACVSPHPSLAQKVLGVRLLREFGAISYGLYLWHWPVVVYLTPDRVGLPPLLTAPLQVMLSVALAWASLHLVEQRVRRRGFRALVPRHPGWAVALATASLVGVVVGSMALARSAPDEPVVTAVAPSLSGPPRPKETTGLAVALVGNSIPQSLLMTFPAKTFPGVRVVQATNFGCDPFDAPAVSAGRPALPDAACLGWRENWPTMVRHGGANLALVFLSQAALAQHVVDGQVVDLDQPAWREALHRHFSTVTQRARGAGVDHVVWVNLACHEVPDFGTDRALAWINDSARVSRLNALLEQWAAAEKVPVIDQFAHLCPDGDYRDTLDGQPLYSDYYHFTRGSGAAMWGWLVPQLREIAGRR